VHFEGKLRSESGRKSDEICPEVREEIVIELRAELRHEVREEVTEETRRQGQCELQRHFDVQLQQQLNSMGKKRGRKPKYETDEERHEAKLRQTRESNKRLTEKRKELEARKPIDQKTLVKELINKVLNEAQAEELLDFYRFLTREE
jgi:hypothetical protein